jgi:tRNA pseudouridine13 synthase
MQRIFKQDHAPIFFNFVQNKEDFIVNEIPLWDKQPDKGNYLIIKVQKKNLSTLEMLELLEHELQCFSIGYAGLKDKHATTTQYLSLPLKFSKALEKFRHPRITILEQFRSPHKINIGDLAGNHFTIRLKKVKEKDITSLSQVLDEIMRYGMPNYFGYQRFGKETNSFEQTREVAQGEKVMKDKRIHKLMLHGYQSYLFNAWLAERITLAQEITTRSCEELLINRGLSQDECDFLKSQNQLLPLLPGDVMVDKQNGKWVNVKNLQSMKKPYKERKLIPTGLLVGRKVWRAQGLAGKIEEGFDDLLVDASGARREAVVFPKKIRWEYEGENEFMSLSFSLDKGAYATVLLENLANRDLTP